MLDTYQYLHESEGELFNLGNRDLSNLSNRTRLKKTFHAISCIANGMYYNEIANEVGVPISYVQRCASFLEHKKNDETMLPLLHPTMVANVYKLGMEKRIVLYPNKNIIQKKYMTRSISLQDIQGNSSKNLAFYTYPQNYTFPKEETNFVSEIITPFYPIYVNLTTPLFKEPNITPRFFKLKKQMRNEKLENILTGIPSFEPGKVDLMNFLLCKYSENTARPGILNEILENNYSGENEINYNIVKNRMEELKKEGIIAPGARLNLEPLEYKRCFLRINTNEISKIMKTFNELNMPTRVALIKGKLKTFYLDLQFPFYHFNDIMEILAKIDSEYKIYLKSKFL